MRKLILLFSFFGVFLYGNAQHLSGPRFIDLGETVTYEMVGLGGYDKIPVGAVVLSGPVQCAIQSPNSLLIRPTTSQVGMYDFTVKVTTNYSGAYTFTQRIWLGPYTWPTFGPERLVQGETGHFGLVYTDCTLTGFNISPSNALEQVSYGSGYSVYLKASSTYTGKVTLTVYLRDGTKTMSTSRVVYVDPAP